MRISSSAALLAICFAGQTWAQDWPLFRGDATRSGFTEQKLPDKLSLRWVAKNEGPAPAWPVSTRLGFDRGHHPVVSGGTLFYGSSADCQIHALDAASGKERWTFFTNSPVRFAPALWKDRVFAASDDGCLYCLAAADGTLLWKKQGGPNDRLLLGNDRLGSRWPARGGPVVFEDTVYFAAGIWPSEGIYIYALEAATGKQIWCNDTSGSIFMGQPHGGAFAASGVAAQGYLVVNGSQLLVPTGRAVPAVFERATGKFKYFFLQENGHKGGSSTVGLGPFFYNAGFTYDAATGKVLDAVGAGEVAAVPDGLILSSGKSPAKKAKSDGEVVALRWIDKTKADRKGEPIKYKGLEKQWTVADVAGGASVLVADNSVICGGEKRVTRVDRTTKKVVWSAAVDGTAHGLAIAGGKLFVSTDQGAVYCFDDSGTEKPSIIEPALAPKVEDAAAAALADEIIKQSGVSEGYCVDLGCGDGSLVYELAKRTKLTIYAVDADPVQVALARKKLTAAGVYGTRVTVHLADPGRTPYPKYFADLVVSSKSGLGRTDKAIDDEAARVQRPFGGVSLFGKAGSLRKNVRGPLEGAGEWTHQYADPGNTCCSADAIVQGPLGMLWFRDSDLESPSRHGRAPAPLFHNGRLFVEGTNAIRAVDAYNGRTLWEYPLPGILKAYHGEHLMGTAGTNSNYCVSADGVYVRAGSRCLRLDPATGKKLGEFEAPPLAKDADGKTPPWGYIAYDKGLLYGSLADAKHIVKYTYGKADMSQLLTESTTFFALDAVTGKLKWSYAAEHSIRHNAIAIGGGRAYLIDRPLATKDRLDGDKTKEHPPGKLVALDTATGKEAWRSKHEAYGTVLSYSAAHDVLLMSYQPTRFKLPSELGGRLAAFRAASGAQLWDNEAAYVTRPLINGRTVYAQGGAWDLVSGAKRDFTMKRSYGCGQLAGSTHLMVFRTATLGYFDLLSPKGVVDYGGLRPGCWINAIPAGGLVLVPDATSGCQCSYLNQAWIALQPIE